MRLGSTRCFDGKALSPRVPARGLHQQAAVLAPHTGNNGCVRLGTAPNDHRGLTIGQLDSGLGVEPDDPQQGRTNAVWVATGVQAGVACGDCRAIRLPTPSCADSVLRCTHRRPQELEGGGRAQAPVSPLRVQPCGGCEPRAAR